MSRKKSSSSDGGGNWMDTYGDMVTLLLCFFVMLYSMSNINEQKWEVFVKSIFPNASKDKAETVAVQGEVEDSEEPIEGTAEIPDPEEEIDMDTLYLTLAQKLSEMNASGITLSRGEDFTFIVFENKTFFAGESSTLTDEGKGVLDIFCEVIAPAKDLIEQIDIMGYTSQGNPDRPNNPRRDRMLSSERAAEVCIFIQLEDVIEPEKLVSISYGQFRPVDTFETPEGRAKNRRVELLMLDAGADIRSLNEYYDEYRSGNGIVETVVTGNGAFEVVEPNSEGVSTKVNEGLVDEEATEIDELQPDAGNDGAAKPETEAAEPNTKPENEEL